MILQTTAVDDLEMFTFQVIMETSSFSNVDIFCADKRSYITKYIYEWKFPMGKNGGGSGQDNGLSLIINPAGLYLSVFENSASFGNISVKQLRVRH